MALVVSFTSWYGYMGEHKDMKLPMDVIFKGNFHAMDWTFLKNMLTGSRMVYFDSPEDTLARDTNEIIHVLYAHSYVDMAMVQIFWDVSGETFSEVFINLGRDYEQVELLIFLDLICLGGSSNKNKLEHLRGWMEWFKMEYNFNYYICQIDNDTEGEYYFDSKGLGWLYLDIFFDYSFLAFWGANLWQISFKSVQVIKQKV